MTRGAIAALSVVLAACTGGGQPAEDTACGDAPALGWDDWGQPFFDAYCQSCHATYSPNRYGAPDTVVFDTLADVRTFEDAVRQAAIEQGTMPPGGGVPEDELADLASFLECGP